MTVQELAKAFNEMQSEFLQICSLANILFDYFPTGLDEFDFQTFNNCSLSLELLSKLANDFEGRFLDLTDELDWEAKRVG